MRKHGAFLMLKIGDNSEIESKPRRSINGKNRHDGIMEIIGDGLKTEVFYYGRNHNQPAVEQQPAAAHNYDEIFSKLDAILDKRADGLAKSALKDNGVEESEAADIVKAYREQKQTKANE